MPLTLVILHFTISPNKAIDQPNTWKIEEYFHERPPFLEFPKYWNSRLIQAMVFQLYEFQLLIDGIPRKTSSYQVIRSQEAKLAYSEDFLFLDN